MGEGSAPDTSHSSGDEPGDLAAAAADWHARSAPGTFVGRDREINVGLAALQDALSGQGRLVLIAGEPGIGKSWIADELAARAGERGVQVVWGRCWEAGGAPAYWPWVQSFRSLVRDLSAEALRAHIGEAPAEILQLLPGLGGTAGDLNSAPMRDPDAARFRLFESAYAFLRNAAVVRPVMVVLDDLQVADAPSLLLLRFMAGAVRNDRILILGTYRDTELRPEHPLTIALSELAREPAARRMTLRGFDEAEAARVIAAAAGFAPQESLVRAAHDETEGNPLFLREVIHLLDEQGRLTRAAGEAGPRLGTPRSVRDVIGQRLEHLSRQSLDLLSLASVLGREFNVDALSQWYERPFDDVLDALGEPLAARVITDVPGTRSRLRFSHVVIRECLYDDIGRARRVQLHREAAQVLERLYEGDVESHLTELAHHFFEGAPGGDVDTAIDYARRAGDRAVSLLAYEEAVRLYGMALQALELSRPQDPRKQCEVLLALGDAQTRAADEVGAKKTFLQAANLSRDLGLGEQFARAALGYGGRFVWGRAGGDARVIPLLKEGLASLGSDHSELRVRILARLAGALRDDPSREPRESLGRQAVSLARRLRDPATLAYALDGLHAALWRPDNPQERLAIASETVTVGSRAGDRERVFAAEQHILFVFLELGDMAAVYRQLDAVDRMADELGQPAQSWSPVNMRALLALFEGRFGEAEALVSTAFDLRGRAARSDALLAQALQLFQLRGAQGRLAEVAGLVREAAQELTWYPVLRCAVAQLNCQLGREADARAEFESLAAGDFARLPFDNKWMYGMSLLTEVACFLGDRPRAQVLYEKLLPYAEHNCLAAGDGCAGSVSRCLGLLAAASARTDAAARHFEVALERNARMGARPWAAHTQHDFALMLVERDGRGDRERAVELLREALRTSDELAMSALRVDISRALAGVGVEVAAITGEPADEHTVRAYDRALPAAVEGGTFALEGEYWTVAYEGRLLRLRDSKGLRVLAFLLASPGRPRAALDLERLGVPGDEATARAVASGDAGEVIDDEARRAYRARLAELREMTEEAAAAGKADEVGAMRDEIDFIVHELGAALGLGGRSRHSGSIAERARLNVTRAVRSAMKRIAAADADLGAHLEATVHTGTVCVYSPDPRTPISWHLPPGGVQQG